MSLCFADSMYIANETYWWRTVTWRKAPTWLSCHRLIDTIAIDPYRWTQSMQQCWILDECQTRERIRLLFNVSQTQAKGKTKGKNQCQGLLLFSRSESINSVGTFSSFSYWNYLQPWKKVMITRLVTDWLTDSLTDCVDCKPL